MLPNLRFQQKYTRQIVSIYEPESSWNPTELELIQRNQIENGTILSFNPRLGHCQTHHRGQGFTGNIDFQKPPLS
jgi:hypothetical protein